MSCFSNTPAYPLVQNVRDRIEKLTRQKADLEKQYPGLAHLLVSGTQLGTNTVGTDVLIARVAALSTVLSNVQAQASQVMDLEPRISELERRRAEQQKTYESVMARLEQQQRDESMVAGKVINMSQVQEPDPARTGLQEDDEACWRGSRRLHWHGAGACLSDRPIPRPQHQTIIGHRAAPPSAGVPEHPGHFVARLAPPAAWLAGPRRGKRAPRQMALVGNGGLAGQPPWRPGTRRNNCRPIRRGCGSGLSAFLRSQNLNLKKPKLVAVTGCEAGRAYRLWPAGWRRRFPRPAMGTCCWWI